MKQTLPMVLMRLIIGAVFVTEGLLKLLWPELGSGRFEHLGIPMAGQVASFVGIIEVGAGASMIFNFFAGDCALLLLCVIIPAIVMTKIPILLGSRFLWFDPPPLAHYGFLSFMHESRTDLLVLFGLVAILLDSGVKWRSRRWNE
jgi:putative oxidoreductase